MPQIIYHVVSCSRVELRALIEALDVFLDYNMRETELSLAKIRELRERLNNSSAYVVDIKEGDAK